LQAPAVLSFRKTSRTHDGSEHRFPGDRGAFASILCVRSLLKCFAVKVKSGTQEAPRGPT